ncbi:sulfurtransferase complex subunit TusC [Psychrobium sp. 1_MG-2023]|uniref:sulfurtransferase complex subunit TusC n=1 Tax=Psychrobium sp. 1_MG-2023 TaxID=3062624 RepID=UPI000C33D3AF|nr:sulfurtransferase complex subunit TusC [Psychrobium sp. 1_MG-2023]MDP2562976.1 sulfurtransferase complex subunit TusC [Psychrobium sp. 1_MG-2023]PKF59724.1 sulfurtransferase complex subunit TusC [Alteromonadales bacterium alter-6D02]
MKSLAIVNSSAPFSSINDRESLDMLLANASYDRPVGLFFAGDGLYQILKSTDAQLTGHKDISKSYGLLELYDIEQIYLCQQSMNERGLTAEHFLIDGQMLSQKQWFDTLSQFDQVLNF